MLDRRGDQHFAVGARHEHAGADVELDVPERAAAGDVGDRLARLAPLDHRPRSAPAPCGRAATRISLSRSMCSASAISSSASRRAVSLVLLELARGLGERAGDGFTPLRGPPAARLRPRRSARRSVSLSPGPSRIVVELVQRQVDAVVGHSALREIVGADPLGPVA